MGSYGKETHSYPHLVFPLWRHRSYSISKVVSGVTAVVTEDLETVPIYDLLLLDDVCRIIQP